MGEKDVFDDFLESTGHAEPKSWEEDYNKKRCPECSALHSTDAQECSVCGWSPKFNKIE